MEWTKTDVDEATLIAKRRVEHCRRVYQDVDKDRRIEARECQACYYGGKVGGQAITDALCKSCGERMLFGSTNTDKLCLSCADALRLCKHCGGHLYL